MPNNLAEMINVETWKRILIETGIKFLEVCGKIWDSIPAPVKWAVFIFFIAVSLCFVVLAYKNKDEWHHVHT